MSDSISPQSDNNANPSDASGANASDEPRRWQPLSSRQRRVLGVLIEKARTTPDAYPLTLNAITTGCSQKSNRHPQMDLRADDVEDVLEELRGMGAVAEVQTGGRVPKFRHYAYDWFGVDKREIAVLCELMLRGEQTVGDLRARASRMEKIPDQGELRNVIRNLLDKDLMVELTPQGRGQMVTHNLFTDRERERNKNSVPNPPVARAPLPETSSTNPEERATVEERSLPPAGEPSLAESTNSREPAVATTTSSQEIDELKTQVELLTDSVSDLSERLERMEEQLRSLMMG